MGIVLLVLIHMFVCVVITIIHVQDRCITSKYFLKLPFYGSNFFLELVIPDHHWIWQLSLLYVLCTAVCFSTECQINVITQFINFQNRLPSFPIIHLYFVHVLGCINHSFLTRHGDALRVPAIWKAEAKGYKLKLCLDKVVT